jgi:type IV pilus assembly protein PilB
MPGSGKGSSGPPEEMFERMPARVHEQGAAPLRLDQLGMAPEQLEQLRAALRQRSGLIVFTGPIFSGKNTAAYAGLLELRPEGRSMASIEWAVRGSLLEVHQVVLKPQIGLDMASALRAVLRGDHEVIYLREIIDFETAELSLRAVLSDGRLVLTTLHTWDAASVVSRLEDMGFERWRIARSLLLIQAQRQVHRLCLQCRRAIKVDPSVLISAGLPPQHSQPEVLHVPGGCEHCQGTGYDGRVLIFETMPLTSTLQELILAEVSARELQQAAIREGMKTLRRSGLERVCEGLASLDEVLLETLPDAG